MRRGMGIDRHLAIFTAGAVLALAACSPTSPPQASSASQAPLPPPVQPPVSPASQGLTFAAAHCATCHGVTANSLSPVPQAPTFTAIASTPGLTQQTLTTWLRDSHNYPEIMNFEIGADHLNTLSAHMLTLREEPRP